MDDPIRWIPLSFETLVCYGYGFDTLLFGSLVQMVQRVRLLRASCSYGVNIGQVGGWHKGKEEVTYLKATATF